MEREPKRIEISKNEQEEKELVSLFPLKVRNEAIIPPVKSAIKSGCGQCG